MWLAVLAVAALVLWGLHEHWRRAAPTGMYLPRLAWLRAGLYGCACLALATTTGALSRLLDARHSVSTDIGWWTLTAVCLAVIIIAYGVIWPKGTFTDGRECHPFQVTTFGVLWGMSQGLLFLSVWQLLSLAGWPVLWVVVGSYLLIGGYMGVWHRFVWDIHVSPPHNYSEWNGRKVLFCHTPNLVACLAHLAIHGDAQVFVLLQMLALVLCAWAMRFPAFNDSYRATPGVERSLTQAVKTR